MEMRLFIIILFIHFLLSIDIVNISYNHTVDILDIHNYNNLLFFTPDSHSGTTADLSNSLIQYGHSLYIYNYKCELPYYSKLHNKTITREEYLNKSYHKGDIVFPDKYTCSNSNCKAYSMKYVEHLWKTFYNDSIFRSADAIICMFYPSQCQNFIIFNKTTIFMPAHRYTIKRCKENELMKLNNWMFEKSNAHIIVMASGRYDAEYINYYSGKNIPYIIASTLHEYTPSKSYNPEFEEYLFAPFKYIKNGTNYINSINQECINKGYNCSVIKIKQKLKRDFSYSDINKFKAVVVFPYAMLSYYLSDLITSAIPMFVPSPNLMAIDNIGFDARNSDYSYCYTRAFELPKHRLSKHKFSPEDKSIDAVKYWVKYASFYTPCSISFDNISHLVELMQKTNYKKVYECNIQYHEEIKSHNKRVWIDLFSQIQKNRKYPDSIEESIEYLNDTIY